jgi:ribosome-associated heat shock protein Hsp15
MSGEFQRLDKFLWFARIVRTRSLAARLCISGLVTVGGVAVVKPRHPIRVGDRITVPLGRVRRTLVVMGLGERRGPAAEARLLYEEIAAPTRLAELAPAWEPILVDSTTED